MIFLFFFPFFRGSHEYVLYYYVYVCRVMCMYLVYVLASAPLAPHVHQ